MTGPDRTGKIRVSVVELTDTTATVAPHDHRPWMVLPLDEALDGGVDLVVGQVGTLERDAGAWFFEPHPSARVELVSLGPSGPAAELGFKLGKDKNRTVLTGHGIDSGSELRDKAASELRFWRLLPGPLDGVAGHFDVPDVVAWADGIRDRRRREEAERADNELLRRRQDQRDEAAEYFVNPYTFVPFPDEAPRRRQPAGHHELGAGRFSGRLTATLTTRSPLLVRGIGSEAPKDGNVATAPRRDGALFVPGSSLHGSLRSLHEALTGSCLRVFDPDFTPVYRDLANTALRQGWGLGVVAEVSADDGHPTKITCCTDTRWVPLQVLAGAVPRDTPVTTGQRFTLDQDAFSLENNRWVYGRDATATHDDRTGQWVVLVTDPAARDRAKSYYCAVGRLPAPAAATVEVTGTAWRRFRSAAAGVKGHYRGENDPRQDDERQRLANGEPLVDVLGPDDHGRDKVFWWPDKDVGPYQGRWLRPRPWLHVGQVIWLAPAKGGLTDGIALSYLWRTAGAGAAVQRLQHKAFQACHDPDKLCPSCRLFGSADLAEDGVIDRRRARQRSYRGHVRVLDTVAESARTLPRPVTLPALGSPRPGSGQFYLDDEKTAATSPPRNRWGGIDATDPRTLRGRKFYWHTDPAVDERRNRWRRHTHPGAPEGDQVELVAAGSSYAIDLRFDNVDLAELGGLVAALQPHELFARLPRPLPYPTPKHEDEPEYAIHVGGGKPLGLGSCRVTDLTIEADDASSRYLGGPRPVVDAASAVAAFLAEHHHLAENWRAVAAALHTAHVDSRIVGYPTAVSWADDDGSCSGKLQHRSFAWFQVTTGERLPSGAVRPFTPLPPVTDIAQGLPVDVSRERP